MSDDKCFFCGGPNACYERRDETKTYRPACFDCAKQHPNFPVPKGFEKQKGSDRTQA
jgi:hypothetical protein